MVIEKWECRIGTVPAVTLAQTVDQGIRPDCCCLVAIVVPFVKLRCVFMRSMNVKIV